MNNNLVILKFNKKNSKYEIDYFKEGTLDQENFSIKSISFFITIMHILEILLNDLVSKLSSK